LGAASHAPYMLNRNDSQARKSSQVETTKAGILNCFRGLECDGWTSGLWLSRGGIQGV